MDFLKSIKWHWVLNCVCHQYNAFCSSKVLTNEKRGGLIVILFDRFSFQLFTRKFSNKSVQSSSCETHKTAQRTLFQFFANKNGLTITLECRRCMKKSVKLACNAANSNNAIGSLPTLPNIARICYLKRFIMKFRLLKYLGGCTIPSFQLSVWCEKWVAAQHDAVICKRLLISNDRNRVRWVVLGLSEDGTLTDLSENLSVNSLKGDLSNATTFNPLFSQMFLGYSCYGK